MFLNICVCFPVHAHAHTRVRACVCVSKPRMCVSDHSTPELPLSLFSSSLSPLFALLLTLLLFPSLRFPLLFLPPLFAWPLIPPYAPLPFHSRLFSLRLNIRSACPRPSCLQWAATDRACNTAQAPRNNTRVNTLFAFRARPSSREPRWRQKRRGKRLLSNYQSIIMNPLTGR